MNNGFSSPCADGPLAGNPRVHIEGRQNYERNHKASDWFGHNDTVIDVKPESRLKLEAVRVNAEKNRGSTKETLQTEVSQANTEDDQPQTADVHEMKNGITGEDAGKLSENFASSQVSQDTKVKSAETNEHEEKEQRSASVLTNHSSADSVSNLEHPVPAKLRSEEGETVVKSSGEQATVTELKSPRESKVGRLHQESSGGGWDESVPHHRVRNEGEAIAQKNSSDSVTEIFAQANSTPQRKEPKVLQHMTETYTPRKPAPHRVNTEGLRNLEKAHNQSEMSAIMHGKSAEPTSPRPTSHKKDVPHQKTEHEMSAIMHGSPVGPSPPRPSSGRKMLPHLQKSQLEMSAIMHGKPADPKPCPTSSGRKILPHLQRSELW